MPGPLGQTPNMIARRLASDRTECPSCSVSRRQCHTFDHPTESKPGDIKGIAVFDSSGRSPEAFSTSIALSHIILNRPRFMNLSKRQ